MGAVFHRYRVQLSFRGMRAGSTVEIDPTDPGWAPHLERGWLVPIDAPTNVITLPTARAMHPSSGYDPTLSAEGG